MRRSLGILALMLCLSSCGSDSTAPPPGLEGSWNLIGYSDHGVSGATTGTAQFETDGTFSIEGTVTYPGEPTDPVAASGTYNVEGNDVVWTVQSETSTWSMAFTGDRLVLSLAGSAPPTTITLQRQP